MPYKLHWQHEKQMCFPEILSFSSRILTFLFLLWPIHRDVRYKLWAGTISKLFTVCRLCCSWKQFTGRVKIKKITNICTTLVIIRFCFHQCVFASIRIAHELLARLQGHLVEGCSLGRREEPISLWCTSASGTFFPTVITLRDGVYYNFRWFLRELFEPLKKHI